MPPSCGVACSGGKTCQNGLCKCPTTGKTLLCNGVCYNPSNDATHCGNCATVCAIGATCTLGSCVCPAGQVVCNGRCVNTNTDTNNCGACGNICTFGETCTGGSCHCGAGDCSVGETCSGVGALAKCRCGATSVNPTYPTCYNAAVPPAGSDYRCCSSQCVNTKASSTNCGSCGNICPVSNACLAGTCACLAGQANCAGVCTPYNDTHCGPTCIDCKVTQGAGGICNPGGTCGCVAIPIGTACAGRVCGTVSNGCLGTYTCGAGTCPGGQTCNASGQCVCPVGQADCAGTCTAYDSTHCGASCTNCLTSLGSGATCTPGGTCTCSPQTCGQLGFNCGTNVSDTCLGTIPSCGTCTGLDVCSSVNGGICGCIPVTQGIACLGRFCGTASNGCLGTYSCGAACTGGQICNAAGQCTCPVGQINCLGICIDPTQDGNNCGACGNVCPVNETCSGSVCHCGVGVTCPSGQSCGVDGQCHCGVATGPICTVMPPQTCCSGSCVNGNSCGPVKCSDLTAAELTAKDCGLRFKSFDGKIHHMSKDSAGVNLTYPVVKRGANPCYIVDATDTYASRARLGTSKALKELCCESSSPSYTCP